MFQLENYYLEYSMPSLHIIIGDANTRKSSLLKCLTGFGGRKRNMDVSLANNGGIIAVHCRKLTALQEDHIPESAFIQYINALNPIPAHIAVILRVGKVGGRVPCPSALAYIQAFITARWQVQNIALLDSSACTLHSALLNIFLAHPALPVPIISQVSNSSNLPTNEFAQQVRQDWGWL